MMDRSFTRQTLIYAYCITRRTTDAIPNFQSLKLKGGPSSYGGIVRGMWQKANRTGQIGSKGDRGEGWRLGCGLAGGGRSGFKSVCLPLEPLPAPGQVGWPPGDWNTAQDPNRSSELSTHQGNANHAGCQWGGLGGGGRPWMCCASGGTFARPWGGALVGGSRTHQTEENQRVMS